MRAFRWVIAALLFGVALVVWAGPAFGLLVVATGGELHVRGGAGRVLIDVSVGAIAAWLAIRATKAAALHT